MNSSVYVNSLKLPDQLIKLIEEGRWKKPENTEKLREMTKFRDIDRLSFMEIEWMKQETAGAFKLAKDAQLSQIYGLKSSKYLGEAVNDIAILDIDLAVIIMVNFDEEAVFLDYRPGKNEPRVLASYFSENEYIKHRQIADSFGEFANFLEL